jgi:DNA polymerase III alpha subunit
MVILHPVTFTTPEEYELHKILRAIDHNTLISKLTEAHYCKDNEMFTDKKSFWLNFNMSHKLLKTQSILSIAAILILIFQHLKTKSISLTAGKMILSF